MEFLQQLFFIGWLSLPVVGLTALFTGGALALQIYAGGARFNAETVVPSIVAIGIVRELFRNLVTAEGTRAVRNWEELLEGVYVYRSNYKLQNLALWVPLATIEFAILDMLGIIADKPAGRLIGSALEEADALLVVGQAADIERVIQVWMRRVHTNETVGRGQGLVADEPCFAGLVALDDHKIRPVGAPAHRGVDG